jgi:uncharacterized membrane protein
MAVQMRYGDYIKGGFEIVKANLVPSIVFALLLGLPIVSLAGPIFMVNFLAAVKAAKHEGKPIQIGDLFNFENAVDKWVGPFIVAICIGIGNMCFVIPGILLAGILYFTAPILADKPGTPFLNAIKGAASFGKANMVPCVLLAFVLGLVAFLGVIGCGVGILITLPTSMAAGFLAYEDHRSAIEAAAADGGVQI